MNEEAGAPTEDSLEEKLRQVTKEKDVFAAALVEFNQSFDRKIRELSIIRQMSDTLLSSFGLDTIACKALDIIAGQVALVNCSIMLLDEKGENLVLKAARGMMDEKARLCDGSNGCRRIPVGVGVAGSVAQTGKAILLDDVSDDSRFIPFPDSVKISSLLSLPLISKEKPLGVLNLSDSKPMAFSKETERVLVIVAAQVSMAIENAMLIERLLENERISALGKMAATMIHDMKNPLQVISGYAELLASKDMSPDEKKDCLGIIIKQVDRFTALTEETLEFARGVESNPNRMRLRIRDLASEVEASLKPEFDRLGVEIETRVVDDDYMVMDGQKMLRVLINLASNARDVMPGGGKLIFTYSRLDGGARIEVEDTGPGVPEAIIDSLFDPFVTMGKSNGTGLGLAIVKKIVESHNGSIRVGKGESGGALFTIDIPDD